jgi:hypothetical protein
MAGNFTRDTLATLALPTATVALRRASRDDVPDLVALITSEAVAQERGDAPGGNLTPTSMPSNESIPPRVSCSSWPTAIVIANTRCETRNGAATRKGRFLSSRVTTGRARRETACGKSKEVGRCRAGPVRAS